MVLGLETSTDGSDEASPLPRPTLSFLIVQFHLSGPVCQRLAMIAGQNGLRLAIRRAKACNCRVNGSNMSLMADSTRRR